MYTLSLGTCIYKAFPAAPPPPVFSPLTSANISIRAASFASGDPVITIVRIVGFAGSAAWGISTLAPVRCCKPLIVTPLRPIISPTFSLGTATSKPSPASARKLEPLPPKPEPPPVARSLIRLWISFLAVSIVSSEPDTLTNLSLLGGAFSSSRTI